MYRVLLLLLLTSSLNAEEYLTSGVSVLDGDTVKVEYIQLPWNVALSHRTIRALGYDAYESSKHRQAVEVSDNEVIRGKEATEALKTLLSTGDLYISPGIVSQDNYGRLLAKLSLHVTDSKQIIDIADWMKSHNFNRTGSNSLQKIHP